MHSITTSNPSVSTKPCFVRIFCAVTFAASRPAATVSGLGARGRTWPEVAKPSLTAKLTRSSLLLPSESASLEDTIEKGSLHVDDDRLRSSMSRSDGASEEPDRSSTKYEDALACANSCAARGVEHD